MNSANGQGLPLGWVRTQLGVVVEPRSGKSDPRSTPGVKFIGMEQIEAHTMRLLGTVPADSMKSAANVFWPNDVLYGRLRSYLNKVYQPDFAGLCSGEFIVLSESAAILGRFLKYRLNAGDFVRFASRINTGDRPRVDFDQIKTFEVLLPPGPEQERVADTLDELLSDLDAGVAALGRVRKKLTHYRSAVLKAAMEGTLTEDWRQQHADTEPASVFLARILAARRQQWEEEQLRKFEVAGKHPPKNWKTKYKEPLEPDITGLPSAPQGWCWASLDQIADIAGGVTKGQKFSNSDNTRVVPYLRVANVQRGFLDMTEMKEIRATENDIQALRLQPGDVLFNEGGDRDKLGRGWIWEGQIAECIHQNHVFRARLISPEIQPKIISWSGNSYGQRWFMRTGKQSVNLASINLTVLRSFPVPLVPAAEQEAVVEAVEDQLSLVEHLEANLGTKLQGAQVLRQATLSHAFSGQLLPQDPNDEPASYLLERIAAERRETGRDRPPTRKKQRTRTMQTRASR